MNKDQGTEDRRRGLRALTGIALAGVGGRRIVPLLRFGVGGAGLVAVRAAGATAAAPARPLPLPPQSAKLEYVVHLDDYRTGARVASMVQQFEHNGDRYSYRSEAQATGLLAMIWRGSMVQLSEGSVDAQGLHPMRFEDRRGKRKPRGATVDTASRVATFVDGQQAPAPEGTQDRLSVLVQLGLLLGAAGDGGRLPTGHVFEFPMLATSRVKSSQWRIEDDEELRLESGSIRTIRVHRLVPPGDDAPSIDAWFDPARLPWPVRMRVAEPDGQALDQVLQKID